jgi:hypothetical protein
LPPVLTVLSAAGLLVVLVVSGGYRRVELVGVARGLFELAFVAAAVFARPSVHALASGFATQPLGQPGYLTLAAANVGGETLKFAPTRLSTDRQTGLEPTLAIVMPRRGSSPQPADALAGWLAP